MKQNIGYISLDSVVTDFLTEAEYNQSKYFKIWQIAYRGLEDLGLDAFYGIKSVKLPINANKTVELPADFLKWTKVGILNNHGEVIPLYYNDKLTTYADVFPDRIEATTGTPNLSGDWGVNSWWNYWNGYAYTNIYGAPSGAPFAGDFKIDLDNGVILLNDKFKYDYVILEYVASPKPGGEYYLPVQFREALISWVRWKDSISIPVKSRPQQSNVEMKRRDYYNDRRVAIARWKPTRAYDMYQVSQEMRRMAIRT